MTVLCQRQQHANSVCDKMLLSSEGVFTFALAHFINRRTLTDMMMHDKRAPQ